MNARPWDSAGQARRALDGIVRDPQYGAAALSQPAVMSNLLKDLLPDEPREAGLLVAAAQADLAGALRGYVAQGLDPATAVSLTSSSFVSSTSHTQEAGAWVVTELALALGLDPYRTAQAAVPQPSPLGQPASPAPVEALVNQAAPPYQVASPAQPTSPVPVEALVNQAAPPYQVASPAQPAYGADGAANPWQPPAAVASPRPVSRGPVAPAVISFVGALLLLIACFVPLDSFSGQPSFGVFFGHIGFAASTSFWLVAIPIVTLLAAITAGIGLLVPGDRPRGRAMFDGMLIALGMLTVVIFAFYGYGILPESHHGAGGPLGIVAGIALLLGGVVGMAADGNRGAVPAGASGTASPGTSGTASPGTSGTASPGASGTASPGASS